MTAFAAYLTLIMKGDIDRASIFSIIQGIAADTAMPDILVWEVGHLPPLLNIINTHSRAMYKLLRMTFCCSLTSSAQQVYIGLKTVISMCLLAGYFGHYTHVFQSFYSGVGGRKTCAQPLPHPFHGKAGHHG